jgi:hypothetical protein
MRRATALMYVGAGLTVVSAVLSFATSDQLADALADATGVRSDAMIDRAVADAQVQELFRTVIGVCLWVWMAIKNGEGRRWARVVATVFGIINVFGFAFGFLVMEGLEMEDLVDYLLPQLVLGAASVVLGVVILFQLHHPESAYYYDEAERYQAAMTLRGYR